MLSPHITNVSILAPMRVLANRTQLHHGLLPSFRLFKRKECSRMHNSSREDLLDTAGNHRIYQAVSTRRSLDIILPRRARTLLG